MKFCIAAILVLGLIATAMGIPLKKRMVYYSPQAPMYYAARQAPLTQRLMYVQYVQPSQTHARSTNGVSTFVAGDSVAAGSYIKGADDAAAAEEPAFHSTSSVAEAYPAADEVEFDAAGEVDEPAPVYEAPQHDDDAQVDAKKEKTPKEFAFEHEDENTPLYDAVAETEAEDETPATAAAPAPVAPAQPPKRYLPAAKPPKRKIHVELEAPAAPADDDDDDEFDSDYVPAVRPARVPARKPTKQNAQRPTAGAQKPALPAGTFFPINFGGTAGGAIAIANSFSTGEGGSATSHAIAYGNPEAARVRTRPSYRH